MKCEHMPEQIKLVLTPTLIHYGKWVCECGAFIGWQPKPATVERIALNERKLEHARNGNGLTDWEKKFVASLDAAKLSPKQQAILDRIAKETGFE